MSGPTATAAAHDPGVVHGTCDPAFLAVREEFGRNLAERGELGAALHVSVDGRAVVDLWGGTADPATGRAWEADTLVVAYSCTKGVVALAAHLLVDRGLLGLDAPVSRYWPEYGCAGKEGTTVRMLLDHTAGVPAVTAQLCPGDMYDADLMAGHLARQRPWWEPGTQRGYHLVTFGWTVGEVVRRVSGRNIGRFVAEELAGPLGADFFLGLPVEHEPRVAGLVPWVPGPDTVPSAFAEAFFADPTGLQATAMGNVLAAGVDASSRDFRAAEMGGMGGLCSARGLAAVYAPLAQGGGGLVSRAAVDRMSGAAGESAHDVLLLVPTRFGLGFMASTDNRHLVPRVEGGSAVLGRAAFGHVGMGGSIGFADPEEGLAVGYVMNRHGEGVLLNERGQSLVDAVYRSLGHRTDASGAWVR